MEGGGIAGIVLLLGLNSCFYGQSLIMTVPHSC